MSGFESKLTVSPSIRRVMFDRIAAGKFDASVQSGEGFYAGPGLYEIAIFEGREWVNPRTDPRFVGKEWAGLFEEGQYPVAGYVPTATVEQILADLEATP